MAVAAGDSIGDACKAAGVSRHDVRHYRLANPEASREWDLAREQSADAYADRIAELAESPGADANQARVRIDAYKWLASKRNPRVYSDKQQVDVNVKTVDLTRIIEQANARLAASRNPELAARAAAAVDAQVLHAALPQLEDLL